jgi:hypothetical protein
MFPATVPVLEFSQDPSTAQPALTFVSGGKTGRSGRDDNGGGVGGYVGPKGPTP